VQVAPTTTTTRPGHIELRLPVDGAEAPFAYPDADGCLALEMALSCGGYVSLVLATDDARCWAGEAFAAISTAYREATDDPVRCLSKSWRPCPRPPLTAPGPGCTCAPKARARRSCASTWWSMWPASAWTKLC